ncbi:unannotated protein [freshwater metagenome]|uniref:Unannotated protein n=1 Tax=freshwater metagenome TaxID=449393 RepID=A0A6J7CAE0_9ZZZZ
MYAGSSHTVPSTSHTIVRSMRASFRCTVIGSGGTKVSGTQSAAGSHVTGGSTGGGATTVGAPTPEPAEPDATAVVSGVAVTERVAEPLTMSVAIPLAITPGAP